MNNKVSGGELLLREIVSVRYTNDLILYNKRPSWLTNPTTGRKLELDIWVPHKKIAFEFNGFQHNKHYQSFKDTIKKDKCHKKGIVLYYVWPTQLLEIYKRIKTRPLPKDLYNKCLRYTEYHTKRFKGKTGFGQSHDDYGRRRAKDCLKYQHYKNKQDKEYSDCLKRVKHKEWVSSL